jgi:hypothetical protein
MTKMVEIMKIIRVTIENRVIMAKQVPLSPKAQANFSVLGEVQVGEVG